MMDLQTRLTERPRRRFTNGFVALFVIAQVWIPASYYFRGGGPDERFAWRMFSTQHMHHQAIAGRSSAIVGRSVATDDGVALRHTPVEKILPKWWVRLVEMRRPAVLAKLLENARAGKDVIDVQISLVTPPTGASRATRAIIAFDADTGRVRVEETP